MFRPRAQDDRNQQVRLVRWLPRGPRPTLRSPLTTALAMVGAIAVVGLAAIVLVGPDVVGLSIFSMVIAPTMAVVLTALANIRNAWRDRSHTLRAWMGAHGLCAACAYDLSRHDPEPDGCTVCPECSAAWRLATDLEAPGVTVIRREP